MLNKIKSLADDAIALQNKNRMDEVLREISALCGEEKQEPLSEKSLSDALSKIPAGVNIAKGAKNAK